MLGKLLEAYRLKHDLTFEGMAAIINRDLPEYSHVHYSTLVRIVGGARPNARTRYKIEKVFPDIFKDAA